MERKRTFIIAELSANHNQSLDLAIKTIKAAKSAGADAIKLQTYTPDTITIDCDNDYFVINQNTLWDGQTLYNLYKNAYTPWKWHKRLKAIAEDVGLVFFSSPFDFSAVDFLEELDIPIYKIASPEITDIPLIRYVASTGKPVILSTGVATEEDIELAVKTCVEVGNNHITLLKCTSAYPTPYDEVNLSAIPLLKEKYEVKVGLSDHTKGYSVAIGAVALGAEVVEKHFILDRKIGGPDASFSMEPDEFKIMVDNIRILEKSLGSATLKLTVNQQLARKFCRSLFVVENMKKGEVFTKNNIRSIRPGDGLHPKYLDKIIGKKAKMDLVKGTPINWDLLE